MRKLKFRGVSLSGGLMVVGGGVDMQRDTPIIINQGTRYFVDEKTIGQFTGLRDKNGVDFYEGDILKTTSEILRPFDRSVKTRTGKYSTKYQTVEYREESGCFCFVDSCITGISQKIISKYSVVDGNIHENPELIS